MNGIAKPRIGNGVAYFVAAGSLVVLSVAAWLLGAGDGRETRSVILGALALAAVGVVAGFLVHLFGLVEQRLIEVQTALQPVDSRPASGPPAAPVGVDRYGLPLHPPEIAGLSGGA